MTSEAGRLPIHPRDARERWLTPALQPPCNRRPERARIEQNIPSWESAIRVSGGIRLYDPVDPFHPDPGFSLGLLPGLAPVTILAEEDPASDRYLFAETTLVRERNRLLEALALSRRETEALSARLR